METQIVNEIVNESILQALVKEGETNWSKYGDVYVKEWDGLILFNYSPLAQFKGRWNWFERVSRGLILNRETGEVVARPFDKFFNYGERDDFPVGNMVSITEKVDGSLGILYRPLEGGYAIATRGSFHSAQALWATNFLATHNDLTGLDNNLTLLFEIIYPDNRIVVDYRGAEALVLLAARNRNTGEYLPMSDVKKIARQHGFLTPVEYSFSDVNAIVRECTRLDTDHEGFVVTFDDGSRYKFKGDEYLKMHRMMAAVSWRNTIKACAENKLITYLVLIPPHMEAKVYEWVSKIVAYVSTETAAIERLFEESPMPTENARESRKAFAQWVSRFEKSTQTMLFARYDGRPYDGFLYKELAMSPDEVAFSDAE